MTGEQLEPSQSEQEPVVPIPVSNIEFVIGSLRLSLQQNAMTREQAIEKIQGWYPDAVIKPTVFDE